MFIEFVGGATNSKFGLSHFETDNKYRIQDVGQIMSQMEKTFIYLAVIPIPSPGMPKIAV